jgi:type VI protein secretion system component Hcp
MDLALRVSIRKLMVVSLVVLSLGIGYAVRNASESSRSGSPHRAPLVTKKFSASQLLLAASSATGMHLRVGGVTTYTGPDHTNDVQIQDFVFSADLPVSAASGGGVRTPGAPAVSEIEIRKDTDKYSLPLLDKLLHPSAPTTATLFFTNLSGPGATAFDYLQMNLTGVYVSKFTMTPGDQAPSEDIRLNFGAMSFTYRISGGATTTVSYNLNTGH